MPLVFFVFPSRSCDITPPAGWRYIMRRIPGAAGDPRISHRRPELSQHFLRDAAVARAIVRRLRCSRGGRVIEAGAGDGSLTEALADAGLRVVAVEKDARLYRLVRERFAGQPDVTCHHADFLTFPLPTTPYCVVSNVPYAITAALVRRLLHAARPPDEALLIVQREAAEKFAGTPRETLFSLLHKPWFEICIAGSLSKRDFVPPPRVASALLRIRRRETVLVGASSAAGYRTFVREAFGHGGPEASRALRPYLTARQVRRLGDDLGFARGCRASHLTFEQWLGVFRFVEHECLGHDPTRWVIAA
jgi:23S rRNA (adenine-N6)-dimethyltransferase